MMSEILKIIDEIRRLIKTEDYLIIISLFMLGMILKFSGRTTCGQIPLILLAAGMLAGGFIIKPVSVGIVSGVVFAGVSVLLYESGAKYLVRKFKPKK